MDNVSRKKYIMCSKQKEHHVGESATGHEAHGASPRHLGEAGLSRHADMVADFRRRFWVSVFLTIPILILSPMIQRALGLGADIRFSGDLYVLFAFSSAVFFYGGYPFLKGFSSELRTAKPGMMTLVAIAITTAYAYSSAVVFGLSGKIFYWELATLIDVMLVGHWIEMKSVMGASRALEELAKLLPSEAHLILQDGSTQDVALDKLNPGDRVLVKPGEKIPADGDVDRLRVCQALAKVSGPDRP